MENPTRKLNKDRSGIIVNYTDQEWAQAEDDAYEIPLIKNYSILKQILHKLAHILRLNGGIVVGKVVAHTSYIGFKCHGCDEERWYKLAEDNKIVKI